MNESSKKFDPETSHQNLFNCHFWDALKCTSLPSRNIFIKFNSEIIERRLCILRSISKGLEMFPRNWFAALTNPADASSLHDSALEE